MSNKNGKTFSKQLFGYKRSDVNDYIRDSDISHSDEVSKLNAERTTLEDKVKELERRLELTEAAHAAEKAAMSAEIKRLTADYEAKLGEMDARQSSCIEKLNDSESRASSFLKMADSASARAESAEAELSIVSAALEDSKNEIEALKAKLKQSETDGARFAELEALAKRAIATSSENGKRGKSSLLAKLFNRGGHVR